MPRFFQWAVVVHSLAAGGIGGGAAGGGSHVVVAFDDSTQFSRYPAYPEQCSTPDQMKRRSIPPLRPVRAAEVDEDESRLVHVSAIFRHGTRAPAAGKDCWPGYRRNVETAVWDCDMTSYLSQPLLFRSGDDENENENENEDDGMLLIEKRYDAFANNEAYSNSLGGTCLQGQLLTRGARQAVQIGQHLRDAYTYENDGDISDGKNSTLTCADRDRRMRLLSRDADDDHDDDNDNNDNAFVDGTIYARSDDFQRTVMTAHAVLSGLFLPQDVERFRKKHRGRHPIIPLHVAEVKVDHLNPSISRCPRFNRLWSDSYQWSDMKDFRASDETKIIDEFMKREIGASFDNDPMDCIMTTMCMDLSIPEAIDDYGRPQDDSMYHRKYGYNLLKRVVDKDVTDWAFHWRYKDGAIAKLDVGPLWAEIMSNIHPTVHRAEPTSGSRTAKNKLALFSVHDSTIMQLLISLGPHLWDGQWAPYAAMLVIEIHELLGDSIDRTTYPSNFAFRLIYNGKVLTSQMGNDCPPDADLCDVKVLLERVAPFATVRRGCKPVRTEDEDSSKRLRSKNEVPAPLLEEKRSTETERLHGPAYNAFLLLCIGFGAAIGSFIAIILGRRLIPLSWHTRCEDVDDNGNVIEPEEVQSLTLFEAEMGSPPRCTS